MPSVDDCNDGGPAPDNHLKDNSALMPMDEAVLNDLIDYVRDNCSESLANDMAAALTGDGTCVNVCENWSKDGSSDATTISVMTRGVPLWKAASVLIHEYTHWTRSRPASVASGDADQTDPETSDDNPCGQCNHANMGVDDIAWMSALCDSPTSTADDIAQLCKLWQDGRNKTAKMLTSCLYAGCSSCCGLDHVPNINEIWPPKPYCCPE